MIGRLALPLALVVAIGAVAVGGSVHLQGGLGERMREQSTLTRQIAVLADRHGALQADLALVEGGGFALYRRMVETGAAADQDRLGAARALDRLAADHDLNRVAYRFQPEAVSAGMDGLADIVLTAVMIDAQAVTDIELRRFAAALPAAFPGLVALRELRIERAARPDAAVLDALRRGRRPDLARASLWLEWRSIRLHDSAAAAP